MSIKYYDKPQNITLVTEPCADCEFLPNVIATDFDDKYYRFYLQDYNPRIIGDTKTKVYKPDGQLGTLGLPYTFSKEYIIDIRINGKSIL